MLSALLSLPTCKFDTCILLIRTSYVCCDTNNNSALHERFYATQIWFRLETDIYWEVYVRHYFSPINTHTVEDFNANYFLN
jgi:hypothetical protein